MIVVFYPHPMLLISIYNIEINKDVPRFKYNLADLTDDGDFVKLNKK